MPETIKGTTDTMVAFGDVVQLSKERSKAPEADGFERYIGLEHLEPSDLRVRTWGDLADGVTFTSVFRPGQVLFGKRRAYQRKVAVADFSGVCSGDIYVLAPKGNRLLPELLPFICQSEPFYDYVISMSQGGLSPRVNWKALSKYEFALPTLEDQRRIVRVLQLSTRLVDSFDEAATRSGELLQATLDRTFSPGCVAHRGNPPAVPAAWSIVQAHSLSAALVTKGATPKKSLGESDTGIPFLKVFNLGFDGELLFDDKRTYIDASGHSVNRRSVVLPGDVLMNIVGPPLGKVSQVPADFPESNINQAIVRYRCGNADHARWLMFYLRSTVAKSWFLRRSKKTSGQENLTLQLCRELPVPMPPPSVLTAKLAALEELDGAREELLDRQRDAQRLRRAAIERVFEPSVGEPKRPVRL